MADPGRRARWAGRAAIALALATAAFGAVDVARNWHAMRPVAPGDMAPLFSLPRADGGGRVSLADARGDVVLVDFWASWCGPCIRAMPAIERAWRRLRGDGFRVLSVNIEGRAGRAAALAAARRLGVTFPVLSDDGAVADAFRVTTIPHLVVIDRRGVVVAVHRGAAVDLDGWLADQVEPLLAAPRP
ncbi:MAG: TlpA family protein disulfide reductase [Deltaproteobacteria bacterium]|nr:MAG: TlpA family protein disulfide reductase [Deltaproteobacteria bacterium]